MEGELKREGRGEELAVEVAKRLGEYGAQVDTAAVKAEQDAARPHNEQMMGGYGLQG